MAKENNILKVYRSKRQFLETPEPEGSLKPSKKDKIFVIQKHQASHLHYDLRLEDQGVLKSWALPKGPPLTYEEKRLAMQTEDHPFEYANFHGVIPAGNYGAGTVEIWDKGTYINLNPNKSIAKGIDDGEISFWLNGKKIKGAYALVKTRFKGKDNAWLMIKMKHQPHIENDDPMPEKIKNSADIIKPKTSKKPKQIINYSIKLGKYEVAITHADKVLFPDDNITKGDLIEYYKNIGPIMLPHIIDRPLMLDRFPNGIYGKSFYQKNAATYFPDWIQTEKVELKEGRGYTNFVICQNIETLVYLANQAMITPHSWLSKIGKLNYPDKLIFDLDPSTDNFRQVCDVALYIREILLKLNFYPYVMTTGSHGLHVVVPLTKALNFKDSKAIGDYCAKILMGVVPELVTQELRKQKRETKIFIDTLRNQFGATAVCPYGVRAHPKAPIATPLKWEELEDKSLTSQTYNISNIFERLQNIEDPLKDFHKHAKSGKSALNTLSREFNK